MSDDKEKESGNKNCKIITGTFTRKVHHIYLVESIEEPYNYIELFNILKNADPEDEINIYINNGGGMLHTVYEIVTSIQNCKAQVIGHLDGVAHSGASMIFLACHGQAVPNHCQLMVHWYSGGNEGKGNEVITAIEFEDKFIKDFYRFIYSGFLTKDELERVFKGEDFWFDEDEINKRLKKKYALIKRNAKELEKNAKENKKANRTVKKGRPSTKKAEVPKV